MMSFVGAIRSGLGNYANFKGRAVRSEYWWFFLFGFLVQMAALSFAEGSLGSAFGNLAGVALLLPSISLGVRRLHDVGKRGWWLIIPIVNIVLLARAGEPGPNSFGPPPPPSAPQAAAA
jgi:uncharacterized membrane protein YhaH (DUF805 family)